MANEVTIISNPTSTPLTVSAAYQRQNTRAEAGTNGIDRSFVEAGPAANQVTLKVGGPVDYNGVLYSIASAVTFTLTIAEDYYIYLAGAEEAAVLTPTILADSGTYDETKNGRYNASDQRILNYRIHFDGTTVTVYKLFDPGNDFVYIREAQIDILQIGEINMYAIGDIEVFTHAYAGGTDYASITVLKPCILFVKNNTDGVEKDLTSGKAAESSMLIVPGDYYIAITATVISLTRKYGSVTTPAYVSAVSFSYATTSAMSNSPSDEIALRCNYCEGLSTLLASDIVS